jgi:chorismate mutase
VQSPANFPRPFVVAGPCSAETEEQVLATARLLSSTGKVHLFRAGLWKPRTRPSSFCGVGEAGLPWLQRVRQETGLDVCTEIALPEHVEACMNHGIRSFWLGARTVSNPFSVQELADSLRACDVCVMIKNPLHPDAELWKGAVDRLLKAGITKLITIHRGFFPFEKAGLRNIPKWEIAIEMKSSFPEIPMICDVSHMAGNRTAIPALAQKALDLDMDGLMIESHYKPESALSDARQQLSPADLASLLDSLKFRDDTGYGNSHDSHLLSLRDRIDSIDEQIIDLFSHRMKIVEEMGHYKKQHNIAIVQVKRWNEIVSSLGKQARKSGLSMEFLNQVLQAIHKESIRKQSLIYKRKED